MQRENVERQSNGALVFSLPFLFFTAGSRGQSFKALCFSGGLLLFVLCFGFALLCKRLTRRTDRRLTQTSRLSRSMPYLTREIIFAGATHPTAGGWGRAQVELLGHTEFPPKKGWVSKLRGKPITDEAYAQFVALKGAHRKAKEPVRIANNKPLSDGAKAAVQWFLEAPDQMTILQARAHILKTWGSSVADELCRL